MAWSPDGQTLASGSDDNTVRLWHVASGVCLAVLAHLAEGWVAFTQDGRYKFGGEIAGGFWHVVNLCRFEIGELDGMVSGLRLSDDHALVPLRSRARG